MRGHLEPAGKREPTEEEAAELARIEAAIATRESEIEEDERYYDEELRDLGRKHSAILSALQIFTDAQKADHNIVVLSGREGIAQGAFTSASMKGAGSGQKAPSADYSRPVWGQLGQVHAYDKQK